MPWLVLLFGLMIAPLGIISIFFIVIQANSHRHVEHPCADRGRRGPLQIPYSLDELLASLQFVRRRVQAAPTGSVYFSWVELTRCRPGVLSRRSTMSSTDRPPRVQGHDRQRRELLPWNWPLSAIIGISLLFTRVTLGAEGGMANADHVIGSLVLTVVSVASAEVARPVRYANVALGAALFVTPFLYDVSLAATIASISSGAALIVLSIRRGVIRGQYGNWNRLLV